MGEKLSKLKSFSCYYAVVSRIERSFQVWWELGWCYVCLSNWMTRISSNIRTFESWKGENILRKKNNFDLKFSKKKVWRKDYYRNEIWSQCWRKKKGFYRGEFTIFLNIWFICTFRFEKMFFLIFFELFKWYVLKIRTMRQPSFLGPVLPCFPSWF